MEKEKKYIIWILLAFVIWLAVSVYWYTCTIKGFCDDNNVVKENYVEEYENFDNNNFIKIDDNVTDRYTEKEQTITNTERRTITCYTYLNSNIKLDSPYNIDSEVEKLEDFLNSYYDANLNVNGIYSQKDMEAVMEFQTLNNLEADGVVGNETLKVINAIYCVKNENKN